MTISDGFRKWIGWSAVGLIAFTACGGANATSAKPSADIAIGVMLPLSGPFAVNGNATKVGKELAQDIVNGSYNLNLPGARSKGLSNFGGAHIRLIFVDHQSNPANGVTDVQRLVSEDHVAAILGAWNSGVTTTASETAERLHIPFLTAVSTAPSLTQRGFQWYFRITPTDDDFARNYFQFMQDVAKKYNVPVTNVAQLNSTDQRGTEVGKAQLKYAQQMGFQMVADVQYSPGTASLTSAVEKLKAANPDVLLASLASDADCQKLLQSSKTLDFRPRTLFVIGDSCTVPGFTQSAGLDAEATVAREVFTPDIAKEKPLVGQVNDMYKQRSGGKDMTAEAARGFMGVIVIADAINRAKSTDPAKIREALLTTDIPAEQIIMPWKGIKFDPQTHDNPLGNGLVVQVQGGKFRAVWPFAIAAVKTIVPFPAWSGR